LSSLKGISALLAGGALIFAACGADQGEQQEFTPAPAETPAAPAEPGTNDTTPEPGTNDMTPEPGNNDMTPEPGTNDMTPEPGANNMTPEPAETPVGQEEPAETPVGQEEPTDEQPVGQQPALTNGVEAMAVVDHDGQLSFLTNGQCTWTEGTAGQTMAGQPGDGSVIQLTFDGQTDGQPTDEQPTESPDAAASPEPASPEPGTEQPGTGEQGTLELSIELARGFAPPAEDTNGEQAERAISSEDVLPFIVMRDQVELSAQINGQDLGDAQVWTGSVAPNGLSGYVVAITQDEQLLTINYLCTTGAQDDAGMPGDDVDQPTESPAPGADESPAIESPAPSP
jgi:hypothetical protein